MTVPRTDEFCAVLDASELSLVDKVYYIFTHTHKDKDKVTFAAAKWSSTSSCRPTSRRR
jgi:hypothetical protein